jgi:hypothetical protein
VRMALRAMRGVVTPRYVMDGHSPQ